MYAPEGFLAVGVPQEHTWHKGHGPDAMYAPEGFLAVGVHNIRFCLEVYLLIQQHLQKTKCHPNQENKQ